MGRRYVYFFGRGKAEGRGGMKDLLGGKGAGLHEMTRIGLPVPAGFVISTAACDLYLKRGHEGLRRAVGREVERHMRRLERVTGRRFGDEGDPLLVSVRSGAARSMPGMMETILNLGLTDRAVRGLAARTRNERFAYDAYRRFLCAYGSVVFGLPRDPLDQFLRGAKSRLKVEEDSQVPAEALREICGRLQAHIQEAIGRPFPQNVEEQLWGAIEAVFRSWMAEKAVTYRRVERITGLTGTAVTVVQMIFGNLGETSGTGVCFTRDPNTGEKTLYGEVLMNAQGEDVVAGIRTPLSLSEMRRRLPAAYKELDRVRSILERHFREMQDLEFTIEEGRLYMLQCRTGKRSPHAAFRIARDLAKEGVISRAEAVSRLTPEDIERLFYPVLDPRVPRGDREARLLATGIGAVPGAASGEVALTARAAEEAAGAGRQVILVRRETSPEDVAGMHAAQGILTATGGKTSHAAVVARGWGKTCIVGCEALSIHEEEGAARIGGRTLHPGDRITLDGTEGAVYEGSLPLSRPGLPEAYHDVMTWADSLRRLGVRANVDTPYDARKAVEMGAQGIGLCRTEHMFFDSEDRRLAIREMILASDPEARRRALARLLPFQRQDFEGIFEAMAGRPVTIRLIDPPLHEFLPHAEEEQRALAARLRLPIEAVAQRVEQLKEANPMLGHRGCRVCLTYPEILDMQVRAIVEAAVAVRRRGIKVHPEIMHPLIMDPKEFDLVARQTRAVADEVLKAHRLTIPYLVGTMIEVPRAALLAGAIGARADFFSFGTNDLTQMTRPVPVPRPGRRGATRALGHRARPRRAPGAQGRHLRRARRRGTLGALLPSRRHGLRQLLAVPHPDSAAGGGAGRHRIADRGAARRSARGAPGASRRWGRPGRGGQPGPPARREAAWSSASCRAGVASTPPAVWSRASSSWGTRRVSSTPCTASWS
ncbi:MAG: pyruvate, phosphate dikinase [Acidobacteria bacterium 13_1_40CM_4_69_4]|nr:MAG: pyruvate, phosphate dikinase [Acidobacteria bacterium 13_1_40CM_4_69_4]